MSGVMGIRESERPHLCWDHLNRQSNTNNTTNQIVCY